MRYVDLDVCKRDLEKYKRGDSYDIGEFRIDLEYEVAESIRDDIGYFVDKYYGQPILEYLLSHYSESDIDDALYEFSHDSEYTVKDCKEILADNSTADFELKKDVGYALSSVLFFDLVDVDVLDKNGYPLSSQIADEYSYQVCRKLGFSDDEIFK